LVPDTGAVVPVAGVVGVVWAWLRVVQARPATSRRSVFIRFGSYPGESRRYAICGS
jgi:hypothetical protein